MPTAGILLLGFYLPEHATPLCKAILALPQRRHHSFLSPPHLAQVSGVMVSEVTAASNQGQTTIQEGPWGVQSYLPGMAAERGATPAPQNSTAQAQSAPSSAPGRRNRVRTLRRLLVAAQRQRGGSRPHGQAHAPAGMAAEEAREH